MPSLAEPRLGALSLPRHEVEPGTAELLSEPGRERAVACYCRTKPVLPMLLTAKAPEVQCARCTPSVLQGLMHSSLSLSLSLSLSTMPARYAQVFDHPEGPGDARPNAMQVLKDEGLGSTYLAGKAALVTGASGGDPSACMPQTSKA